VRLDGLRATDQHDAGIAIGAQKIRAAGTVTEGP
jgi:hypothetical protein